MSTHLDPPTGAPQGAAIHPAARGTGAGDAAPPIGRLSRLQFWMSLAVLLVVFLFAEGSLWQHPWDMALLNGAIVYSYLPIPALVLLGLAYRKRLNLRGFFLDVLELTLLKYSLTFSLALVLWARAGAPPLAPAFAPPGVASSSAPDAPPPAPTPIAKERTGSITGVVVGQSGAPAEGALVFVAHGLEDYVFAPPAAPLVLEDDGTGILPRISGVAIYQSIQARSTDGQLHTLVAAKEGAVLFNIPLMGSGAWSTAIARDALGIATLRCNVHQTSPRETPSHLGVFAHPFFQLTKADGRFRFDGVPGGKLRLGAWLAEDHESASDVDLQAGSTAEVTLSVESGAR